MQNCERCTRWRPASDYGAAESYGDLTGACVPCRREAAVTWLSVSPHKLVKAENRVRRGDDVWAAPFARLLDELRTEREFKDLALWAGTPEKSLRRVAEGSVLTIGIGPVDNVCVNVGHLALRLDDIYPWDVRDLGRDESIAAHEAYLNAA